MSLHEIIRNSAPEFCWNNHPSKVPWISLLLHPRILNLCWNQVRYPLLSSPPFPSPRTLCWCSNRLRMQVIFLLCHCLTALSCIYFIVPLWWLLRAFVSFWASVKNIYGFYSMLRDRPSTIIEEIQRCHVKAAFCIPTGICRYFWAGGVWYLLRMFDEERFTAHGIRRDMGEHVSWRVLTVVGLHLGLSFEQDPNRSCLLLLASRGGCGKVLN